MLSWMCVCASLPMQCFHSFNMSADCEQYKKWESHLWLYTAWTPEELEKTLRDRRSYQAGHLAARAKARLVHLSAVRRCLLQPVALVRTCHCARATQPFVCHCARATQPFVCVYTYVCMYTNHSGSQRRHRYTTAAVVAASRSGEGETRAFKCSPSLSVAVRCTHSHMSLCKSHTTVRVSLCKSHTTVRVCIYICMYVYKSFRQSETAPVHHRRSRRSLPLGRRRDSCI